MAARMLRAALACVLLCAAPLQAPRAAATGSAAALDRDVLVFGQISDDPRKSYDRLRAILDYVVPRLADVGIREGRVLMAADTRQMSSYLRRGRVDWVTETASTGMLLAESSGAEPLLVSARDGVSLYHSVIFVRADSGIDSLDDLRGRSIAFQNGNSTSAFYAPAAALLDAGIPLEMLRSPEDRVGADQVGFVFAQSEINISTWVHKRLVDAGAFSNLDWNDPVRMPPAFQADLRPIHASPDFPRGIELVRPGMDAELKQRLREVLLAAATDPDARDSLERFFGAYGFVPIDARIRESLQRTLRDAKRVRGAVE